jgi:hypothetical protein
MTKTGSQLLSWIHADERGIVVTRRRLDASR